MDNNNSNNNNNNNNNNIFSTSQVLKDVRGSEIVAPFVQKIVLKSSTLLQQVSN